MGATWLPSPRPTDPFPTSPGKTSEAPEMVLQHTDGLLSNNQRTKKAGISASLLQPFFFKQLVTI